LKGTIYTLVSMATL